MKIHKAPSRLLLLGPLLISLLTGCFSSSPPPSSVPSTPSTSSSAADTSVGSVVISPTLIPSESSSLPTGPFSAKILFNNGPNGSFSSAGTTSPLTASQVFNLDGSLLAKQGESQWPAWLETVQIQSNTPQCFGFADATESSINSCTTMIYGRPACGASAGQLRASEFDCPSDSTVIGIQLAFSRSHLGPSENILATIDYFSSALNPTPTSIQACSSSGTFSPEQCSEFTWKTYLNDSLTPNVQPFTLLIPPFQMLLKNTSSSSIDPLITGATLTSRQLILPLASDPTLNTFHILRSAGIKSPLFSSTCRSLSPLCSGVIFYSLTLYRI